MATVPLEAKQEDGMSSCVRKGMDLITDPRQTNEGFPLKHVRSVTEGCGFPAVSLEIILGRSMDFHLRRK